MTQHQTGWLTPLNMTKIHETSVTPVLVGGAPPRVERLTFAGVQDAFRRWWTPQHTLNHLHVLYEMRCMSYPRTDSEAFPTHMGLDGPQRLRSIAEVFKDRGWGLRHVNGWRPNPALFDDRRVGAHTGLHPVFPKGLQITKQLDGLTDEQVLLYRTLAMAFVRCTLDPAVLRVRRERSQLARAVEQAQAASIPLPVSSNEAEASPPHRSRPRL